MLVGKKKHQWNMDVGRSLSPSPYHSHCFPTKQRFSIPISVQGKKKSLRQLGNDGGFAE